MSATVTTFLMFEGKAEEALEFYAGLFEGAEVTRLERYGPQGPGVEGTLSSATFVLGGQTFRCLDSPVHHAFTFTPAISLFVDCESETEIERLYEAFSEGGAVRMALDDYGFSRRFGWVDDRFGVSWQINLPRT